MSNLLLHVSGFSRKGAGSGVGKSYAHKELVTSLSEAIADLDKQVLLALSECPLAITRLQIVFDFIDLVPRGQLAAMWIDSVHRLNEVVNILPEKVTTKR